MDDRKPSRLTSATQDVRLAVCQCLTPPSAQQKFSQQLFWPLQDPMILKSGALEGHDCEFR